MRVLPGKRDQDQDQDQEQERDSRECLSWERKRFIGMEGAIRIGTMRVIRLSGREASVVRAIGFADAALGSEIQDITRMQPEDVADVLNTLIAAGFVESIPYTEAISLAEFSATSFEVNPAYSHELRDAIQRR